MPQRTRPDAITRAQMPASASWNQATPIILGLITLAVFLLILLLFMGIIPMEAITGAQKESESLDSAMNDTKQRAIERINATGSIFPPGPPATPDPILSTVEAPFEKEQDQEEQSLDE